MWLLSPNTNFWLVLVLFGSLAWFLAEIFVQKTLVPDQKNVAERFCCNSSDSFELSLCLWTSCGPSCAKFGPVGQKLCQFWWCPWNFLICSQNSGPRTLWRYHFSCTPPNWTFEGSIVFYALWAFQRHHSQLLTISRLQVIANRQS